MYNFYFLDIRHTTLYFPAKETMLGTVVSPASNLSPEISQEITQRHSYTGVSACFYRACIPWSHMEIRHKKWETGRSTGSFC